MHDSCHLPSQEFVIANGPHAITKFMVFQVVYRPHDGGSDLPSPLCGQDAFVPGSTILGSFDFSDAALSCQQISVGLQLEEFTTANDDLGTRVAHTCTKDSIHRFTANCSRCSVQLQIPADASPAFTTDLVCIAIHSGTD